MTDLDKLYKKIVDSLKQAGLGEVIFDVEDIPKIKDIFREKVVLGFSQRMETEGHEVTQEDLDDIESKVLLSNPTEYLMKAEIEASEIARSIMATIILSDMLDTQLKLGIDVHDKKHDNNIVESVTSRLMEAYPTLMTAAETAGQQILEKYLDTEANNVKNS
jgi:hypothetical protein